MAKVALTQRINTQAAIFLVIYEMNIDIAGVSNGRRSVALQDSTLMSCGCRVENGWQNTAYHTKIMRPLDRIRIEGFKSIKQLDLKLENLNVLIGANGAGKSNFISIFKLLNEMAELRLQLFVGSKADRFLRHGRRVTPKLSVKLNFGSNGYAFALVPSENQLIFESETISFDGDYGVSNRPIGAGHLESKLPEQLSNEYNRKIAGYVVPSVKGWRVYHFHDTSDQSSMKQSGAINANDSLNPDASNLAAFLYLLQQKYPQSYQRIRDTVRLVAPFFDDFVLRPDPLSKNLQDIMLEWREVGSNFPFTAYQLSDGTLRFICLAVVLLQPTPPATIIIDEPELGLHPYAIEILAGLLRSVSLKRQIIVSTQSVPLVNQLDVNHLVVVDHASGESTFSRPDSEALANWLDDYSLGELWEKNILGGRPSAPPAPPSKEPQNPMKYTA